jgi:hypothetical protein
VFAEGQIVLGDLIVFGHIRIEIAFAVKFAEFGNFALSQQTGTDRRIDRIAVRHRQNAGIAHTDRTDIGIGFSAGTVGAGTEHFAFRTDLNMSFQSDNCFVFHFEKPFVSSRFSPVYFL